MCPLLGVGLHGVSILVVLDWAWGLGSVCSCPGLDSGFNPCCIGLGVGTRAMRWRWLGAPKFQSLLYWIGRGDRATRNPAGVSRGGFNPCCIGLGVGTRVISLNHQHTNGFQSLLYWIGRGDAIPSGGLGYGIEVSILVVLDWAWGPAEIAMAVAER